MTGWVVGASWSGWADATACRTCPPRLAVKTPTAITKNVASFRFVTCVSLRPMSSSNTTTNKASEFPDSLPTHAPLAPLCGNCGYLLTGLPSCGICPECGEGYRDDQIVLLDGEGLGHAKDSANGVTSHITNRFDQVDVIVLVDTAKAPMLDGPTSVVRAVAASS